METKLKLVLIVSIIFLTLFAASEVMADACGCLFGSVCRDDCRTLRIDQLPFHHHNCGCCGCGPNLDIHTLPFWYRSTQYNIIPVEVEYCTPVLHYCAPCCPSSRDLKDNIIPLSREEYNEILGKLDNIEVVQYDLKSEKSLLDSKRHIGLISEDAPDEIATKDKKALDFRDYLGFLTAAIKAEKEKIEKQDKEIKDLKKEIEELKRK